MTLRPDTVRERLALVRTNLAVLDTMAGLPRDSFLADRKEQWAAAYALQTTVQALLDAGAHILSGHFKESPREYAEIVPQLVRHDVIDAPLGERLLKVAGFRNILVHEYAAVDYALVHEKLGQLADLAAFAAALDGWLTAQGL
ncbi:MAG TPA: DUF86 domain-containing protein [Candidatus Margulisiibacteriota bacterium]|nr:DUF86 domain-containing protein [Candidatus Margulisiibacteriota bacterium]